jgi:beta-lactamase regulating signal transducer with metallopeptidase domain
MIAGWVVYGLFVSALLWVAALVAERCLQWLMRPTRWVWAAALAGTIAVPIGARFLARTASPAVFPAGLSPAPARPGFLERLASGLEAVWVEAATSLQSLDGMATVIWVAATVGLAIVFAASYRRLTADRTRWDHATIDGQAVRVSGDVGPAVVGIARTEVVLPRWVLGTRSDHRRLILLHEIEHLRAGDARLLFAGLVVAVAMPWNVFAWMQLRRLRLAVEFDCDERVLDRGVAVRDYANLLFDAGRDALKPRRLAPAFVQFDSQLGRRIRKMTEKRHTPRYLPATIAACAAAALVFVACQTPTPTEATLEETGPQTIRLNKTHGEMTVADKEAVHAQLKTIGEDLPFGETVVIESVDGNRWEVDPNHNVVFGDETKLAEFKQQLHELGEQGALEGSFIHREGTDGLLELVELQSGDVVKFRTEHPSGDLQKVQLRQMREMKAQAELKKVKESDVGQF